MARRQRMHGFIDDLREQWAQVVADGEQALANLASAESQLLASRELAYQDATDREEWDAQYEKITGIRETVASLQDAIATVRGWLASATSWIPGLSGIAQVGATTALKGEGRMAAIPVIAGLTVAGLIALVTKISLIAAGAAAFVAYINAKSDKRGLQQEQTQFYVDQGLSLEAAAEQARKDVTVAAQQETGYQFTANINKLFLYGGLGALALMVLPDVIRRMRK